jgi:hypothetical protein
MDLRSSQRKPIALDAALYFGDGQIRRGRTRDMGLTGVFIKTDRKVGCGGAGVEVAFGRDEDGAPTSYRFQARVVRRSREGVGLIFRDVDLDAFRGLQALLMR